MNYKAISYMLGKIFIILGLLMILPLLICVYYTLNGFAEASIYSFIIPIVSFLGLGLLLKSNKPKNFNIYAKEGFIICGLAWIIMSVLGAIPFVISKSIPNIIDAIFESISGFTTTGATILNDIESLPKSILFWRSFTHWIGGMGILSFMIAIVPKAKGNSMFIMKAEVPGPSTSKVVSKIADSARILYIIYFAMTISEIFILYFGNKISGDNIRFFDCVVTSFSNAGTGGFAVLNNSIYGYHSTFTEWVLIVFMFLFGVNFNLYYFLLTKKIKNIFKDEELRGYILINLICVALITLNIYDMYGNLSTAVRHAFFNVNTVMSTTGFGTEDFNLWPTFSKVILMVVMCFGSCAGSTGGGIKIVRIELLVKQMHCDFKRMIRPHSVLNVKLNHKTVDNKMMSVIKSYLNIYIITMVASVLLVSTNGLDTTTNFTAVLSCLNNVGPGLELIGPSGNYSVFPVFSKLILMIDMLAGRLELFPMLLLFSPSTWKKR